VGWHLKVPRKVGREELHAADAPDLPDELRRLVRGVTRGAELHPVAVLTTLRRKSGLTEAGSLGAFVNSVCNNVLFEIYRSETRRRREVSDDAIDPPDTDAGAEATMLLATDRAQVRGALQELGERDRLLLRWLFFEERNKDWICESLGCDRDHLRVLVHRAKGRFREAYKKAAELSPAHVAP
jgi:RNA polymerase sigma-70 factor (ECF subfamily)